VFTTTGEKANDFSEKPEGQVCSETSQVDKQTMVARARSDESKYNLFGSDGIRYMRRPNGKKMIIRYILPTVKLT
jgi:hypothetical protein